MSSVAGIKATIEIVNEEIATIKARSLLGVAEQDQIRLQTLWKIKDRAENEIRIIEKYGDRKS